MSPRATAWAAPARACGRPHATQRESPGVPRLRVVAGDGRGAPARLVAIAGPAPSGPPGPPPAPGGSRGPELCGGASGPPSACTAVGSFSSGKAPNGTTLAEVWNGTKWSIQSMPTYTGGELSGV